MFSVRATDGSARLGRLATANGATDTPALLLYTRRGGCLHLTADLLEGLRPQSGALALDAVHFADASGMEVMKAGGGAHQFLSLGGWLLVATARDATSYEYVHRRRPAPGDTVQVATHRGVTSLSLQDYCAAVSALAPDLFVAFGDEVPATTSTRRVVQSVDRSTRWLDACIAAQAAGALPPCGLLAGLHGGALVEQRQRSAQAAAQRSVAGFMVCGLGTGEAPDARPALLAASLAPLPAHLPRCASGLGAPEEVLVAVAAGCDLLDSGWLLAATLGGYALVFPLRPPAACAPGSRDGSGSCDAGAAGQVGGVSLGEGEPGSAGHPGGVSAQDGSDDTKINLWSLAHRASAQPLLAGCRCYACQRHTRAYVHHLLHTRELLAHVLLELHNTHHFLEFMAAIREAVAEQRFAHYHDWFFTRKQAALSNLGRDLD